MKNDIRQILKQKCGVIVHTSSGAGIKGFPYPTAYNVSKHVNFGLTRTTALDYSRKAILITRECPGFIQVGLTEQAIAGNTSLESKLKTNIPMGWFGEDEGVVEAVMWLCSLAASFTKGKTLVIDYGVSA